MARQRRTTGTIAGSAGVPPAGQRGHGRIVSSPVTPVRGPLHFVPADAPPPATGIRGYGEQELLPALKLREATPRERILPAWAASYGSQPRGRRNRPNAGEELSSELLTQIADTTIQPWRSLVNLTIYSHTGQPFGGSGWLLGSRTVITAGHCVFLRNLNQWASRVDVRVARNGLYEPYPLQSVSGAGLQSVEGWVLDGEEASDIGAVLLPHPVTAGWFGINSGLAPAEIESVLVAVAGYPRLESGEWGTQWAEQDYIAQATEERLYYPVATLDGMSGGPVFYTDPNQNRFAVGIHNYLSSDSQFGIATRINAVIGNYLAQWRNLGDSQP